MKLFSFEIKVSEKQSDCTQFLLSIELHPLRHEDRRIHIRLKWGNIMKAFLREFWEQVIFRLVGIVFLFNSLWQLWVQDMVAAPVTFAMAIFSFMYSNISRFKRFRALGFEAEFWEERQKEAERLIERLKSVVSVYTREVVLQRIMLGRWSVGSSWEENWELYHDLVTKHNELGQMIDFSDLKKTVDSVFLFDIVSNLSSSIVASISEGHRRAKDKIDKESGSPIRDNEGYRMRFDQLNEIEMGPKDLSTVSKTDDVALYVINWARDAQDKLRTHFEIEVELPEAELERLNSVSELYKRGPIEVTDELMSLLN